MFTLCQENHSFDLTSTLCQSYDLSFIPGGRGDSALIRRVCATGVLNLSPCSGVGKPKKDILFWSYHPETKIMFTLYLFNQMSLPFPFSSIMFVQQSFKFSVV